MPQSSERPVDLAAAVDPVASFRGAEANGTPLLVRTSGSGTGVIRTVESWSASFGQVAILAGIDVASRVWVPGPATASMNTFARVHAVSVGASLVDSLDLATHAAVTPAGLLRLLDDGPRAGLTVVVAGDRLSRSLHDRAVSAGLVVHHYYGAAELSFVAWGPHADDLRAFPGVEVDARDGVLWVRSPFLCSGYDGPPGPLRQDPDGFATVGDRGEVRQGRVVVHGRPGAVTTGGATVQMADVERVLAPLARGEVAVVGIPHARLGQVLAGVLTDPTDRPVLTDAARDLLPPAARPRLWLHLPRLPVTAEGKTDRRALERLAAMPDARGH